MVTERRVFLEGLYQPQITETRQIRALALRHVALKDRTYIATLFSQEEGLISLVVNGVSKKNYPLLSLIEPFTEAEFLYKPGKQNLHRFLEGKILNPHSMLRKDLSSLQAAGKLCRDLLSSQLPNPCKQVQNLFALTSSYLDQIPTFPDKTPLTTSFRLKILLHEGVLSLRNMECFFEEDFLLTTEDQRWIFALIHERSFASLKNLIPPDALVSTINNIFDSHYSR